MRPPSILAVIIGPVALLLDDDQNSVLGQDDDDDANKSGQMRVERRVRVISVVGTQIGCRPVSFSGKDILLT